MEGLTIAHVCTSGGWGGLEMYPLDLAQKQMAAGHNALVVGRTGTRLALSLKKRRIPHYCLTIRGYFDPFAALSLAKIVDSEQIDVLHIHFPRDVLLSCLGSRLSKRKVVKMLHKHLSTGVRKMDPLHRILYRDLDLTVAVSQFVKRSLLRNCPLKDNDVQVLECGIDLDRWDPSRVDRDHLRRDYGLSTSNPLVGLVGRLDARKGQEDFVRAAALVNSKYADLRFLIVGDSPDKDFKKLVLRLSHELGLEGRLIFTGHREDMPSVIGGLDLLVVPSKEESFGLVVIEAMALRKPVVVTNRGAFPEFVSNGITGRVVNWNDPEGLAKAIEANFENPEESRAIVERSHQLVRNRFDLSRTVDELDGLYHLLLSRKGLA